ncbi:hypothetical protein [Bradyrhizobium sp. WSM1417]|uniref:hypothetical protein n=1 Tax=Bradyrhizobium sp. WSM1417 TaxID=754500 RepID=UPI000486070F|nr:hypothetical protein [Bradyrhizobium sp. WSM1417]
MKRQLHLIAIAAIAGSIAAGAVQSLISAWAVQNELVPPTSGIYTGVQYSQKIGDAFRSLASCNKGATAPANVGGATVDGLCWIDDSLTPWSVKQYVNGGWAVTGYLDPSNSSFSGVVGGGLGSIASASTTDLGSVPQASVTITGTATISAFGSAAPDGTIKFIRFAGALKLANSAALAVPGGYDLVTAAGDRAIVTHLGSGSWEITQYTRANGIPVDVASVGKIEYGNFESIPPNSVSGYGQALSRASYPVYLAKVTRAQNGTRTSGNATITGIANTEGFGPGMPVEGTGINAGCIIASFVQNTSITLNSSSCVTASGTSAVTVFLTGYGVSGNSTTVGVKDCRGRALAGRDLFRNGAWANRLTPSYFGVDSSISGIANGSEFQTLTLGQLPTGITVAGTIHVTSDQGNIPSSTTQSGAVDATSGTRWGIIGPASGTTPATIGDITSTGTAQTMTSTNTSGNSHPIVPPTLIADCVVRVTP